MKNETKEKFITAAIILMAMGFVVLMVLFVVLMVLFALLDGGWK